MIVCKGTCGLPWEKVSTDDATSNSDEGDHLPAMMPDERVRTQHTLVHIQSLVGTTRGCRTRCTACMYPLCMFDLLQTANVLVLLEHAKYYNRRGTVYVKMITDIHSHSVCVCDCCLVLIFRKGYLCDGVCVYVCLCVLHKHTHIIFQQVVTMFLFLTIQEVEVLFCSSVLIGSWWIFEIESEKCFQEYIVISLWHVDMKKESNILMIDINKSLILICFTSCFIMFPPVGCDLVLICCRLYLQQVLLLRGPQKCLGSTSHCIFMRNFFKVACE